MVDYRKFQIHSDYQTDNIVYSYDGNMPTGDSYYRTFDISHSLPFIPLPFGIFSLDNGATWLPINYSSNSGAGTLTATASKFSISLNDYNGGLPSTIKIRVFAFAPNTYTGNITPPTAISNFMINSTMAYDELLAKGSQALLNQNSLQNIYTHNLGYIPRVMLWIEAVDYQNVTFIKPIDPASIIGMSYYTSYEYAVISTTQLQYMRYSPSINTSETLHYRIYGGQNA